MKRMFALLLITMMLFPVAMADDIINAGAPLEDNPIEIKTTVDTQYIPFTKSIITRILEFIGLEWMETESVVTENVTRVIVDDMLVAVIPIDSKFNGMDVHERCLPYQYGTDNWYECERSLL